METTIAIALGLAGVAWMFRLTMHQLQTGVTRTVGGVDRLDHRILHQSLAAAVIGFAGLCWTISHADGGSPDFAWFMASGTALMMGLANAVTFLLNAQDARARMRSPYRTRRS